MTKVYPYRKILSKDLRESLVNHFIRNPKPKITKEIRSESIDSNIITIQHAELISRWIDKLRVTDKTKNVYEFNLIFRGSRDGFSPSKFHEICDNKYHTISIIKVKDSDEILGGYNPEIWKSNFSDSNTNDSFIFSFKNKENIEDYILSRVDDESYAICNSVNMGPSFGGGDLNLYGDNCYCQSSCYKFDYEESIRDTEDFFSVEEIEIFQIMKIN
ncbi:hypothetical protein C1646_686093 [Rhizophagus diaphanus]|nr:hypothetical protein C1646_686093 [Rhizophagus diaphanus] [Rhizophagus sp. MUCL 43196]